MTHSVVPGIKHMTRSQSKKLACEEARPGVLAESHTTVAG